MTPSLTPPQAFNMARYCLEPAPFRKADKTALLVYSDPGQASPSETWTYASLQDAVLRIAAALEDSGLEPGSRIAIRLENTSTYALAFFGAIAGGFVPLPMSSQLTAKEAGFLTRDSTSNALALADTLGVDDIAKTVMVFSNADIRAMTNHPRRAHYAPTNANDPAYLIYTSGTTANPKGVLHAHRAAWGRRPMYDGWYAMTAGDRMLHAGAFNWTYTLGTGLTDPWANGATSIVYTGKKDPTIWPRLIKKTGATLFAAVPGLFRQILKYNDLKPGDIPTLRHGLVAGEAPPPGLFEDWHEATRTHLFEAIGMSEISTYISTSPSVQRRPGTIGRAQPGRKIAILPVEDADNGCDPLPANTPGLLAVHRTDPGLMLGYWNRPDELREVYRGNWFVGGDLAKIDDDGYVTHLGRANDVIKAMGYRVSPHEIEAALSDHQSVSEIACTQLHVDNGITIIAAFVVLNEGFKPDIEPLQALAQTSLAHYKRPHEYHFLEKLPRTPNGKIRRTDLTPRK